MDLAGHIEDHLFRILNDGLWLFITGIGHADDFIAHINKAAQLGLFRYDIGIFFHIVHGSHISQGGNISNPSYRL